MSTQSINRQPAGVPTGGQFAAGSTAESGVSLGSGVDQDQVRDDTNPLTPSFEATSSAFREALAVYDQLGSDAWDERQDARYRLRSLAVQHAATEDGRADLALRLEGHPEFGRDAIAWCDQGARRGAAIQARADQGIGEAAERIPVAEVRRRFPVGTPVEATYLNTLQRKSETRVVTGQSSHEMKSARADGTEVHNGWSHRQAWEDRSGNIIVADEYGDPYVAYRQADAAPRPQGPDGSHPASVPLNRVFPFQSGAPALGLHRVSMGGVDYVTDRYTALRADHIRPQHREQATVTDSQLNNSNSFSPVRYEDTEEASPDSNWSGTVIGPLVKAGYDIRSSKTSATEQDRATHHVFRDGEHVGFVMDRSRVRNQLRGVRFKDVPQMVQSVSPGAAYTTWEKAHDRFETTESSQ